MSPTVDQLLTFLTIAETLSFRSTARALVVAPAVVSERVRQLEATLGATLFRRTTRSVALTAQGQALIPFAVMIGSDEIKASTVTVRDS